MKAATTTKPRRETLNLRIPPVGSSGTVNDITTSSLQVSGVADPISALTVNLTLTHTQDSDLVITLIAPGNIRIVLSQNRGESAQRLVHRDAIWKDVEHLRIDHCDVCALSVSG